LLGVLSATNLQPGGDTPNQFGTLALRSGESSHNTVFFNEAQEAFGEREALLL